VAAPLVFQTIHRIRFSDLDPYDHMSTANYATYYIDHRMQGVADHLGWDSSKLPTLPFQVFVRRLEIDFIRPVRAGQDVTITSFVREFRGPDALVECTMVDAAGKPASRCLMTVAFVDRGTSRAKDWPADVMALFYEKEAG
jgi:acyl-CoA thioester hydrolase